MARAAASAAKAVARPPARYFAQGALTAIRFHLSLSTISPNSMSPASRSFMPSPWKGEVGDASGSSSMSGALPPRVSALLMFS